MDVAGLIKEGIGEHFILLGLMFSLVVVVKLLKIPEVKGFIGELIVNIILSRQLDNEEYRLLKNVTLNTEDGTTQIDHIIVSVFGIFVLETKNMKGWIFGTEKQKQWTQQIFKKKYKFQNPLHQNYKHTKTIAKNFNLNHNDIKTVIVFVGDTKFKNEKPEGVFQGVGDAVRYIKSHKEQKYNYIKAFDIWMAIQNGRLPENLNTHINHVKHLKDKHQK